MLDLRRDLLVSGTPCVTCVLEMAPTHDNVAVNGCGRYDTDDVVDYKKVSGGVRWKDESSPTTTVESRVNCPLRLHSHTALSHIAYFNRNQNTRRQHALPLSPRHGHQWADL
jgi:hypothetical protein